ncbi:MAG: TraB/GumN family protein [Candidatus Adiutrix sp.]|jgi:uncharacterized protein YbaP (TraB family)|nr:TraB/GumN family protein [Candidatus Adiutrix sp.]
MNLKKISLAFVFFILALAGPLPGPAAALAGHFLWRVESPGGGRIFVAGSIHLARAGLYPLPPAIMEAFGQSAVLAVEINTEAVPDRVMRNFLNRRGRSKDPRPLLERLSPATRQALERSGFYSPDLDPLAPWLAALAIQTEALGRQGFSSQYGLDKYFIDLASQRGLEIVELETLEEQMGPLAAMSPEEADLFLRSAIEEMDDLPGTVNAFLDSWRRGEVEAFAALFFQEYDRYPALRPLLDRVIYQRNERLAAGIRDLLESGARAFVVVGAGHLVGERSVLEHLARLGHRVTQL